MVNFDNCGGLTSVLKFHIFLIFNFEELVCICVICKGLVRFFSDVNNWYSIFTNVKNWYQFFTTQKYKNIVMLKRYLCCVLKVLIFFMKFLVYTLSFCWLHAISNKLLLAQRLEIMDLSAFINSKAKYMRRCYTI